ncbi:MAG: hypothetical protein CMJ32_12280 [Phycisphaerae bacterium]|nr:hypothetical protein [Phycisphaerae bacterium]
MTNPLSFDPFGAQLSPVSLFVIAAMAMLYMHGLMQPKRFRPEPRPWQSGMLFVGFGCLLLAFNAPLAPLGRSLFSVHQINHLLVRLLGPLLIVMAQPWGVWRAGAPRNLRRQLASMSLHPAGRVFRSPWAATTLLIAALYIWQVPAIFGLAQRNPAIELGAHLGMAAAGLWYFSLLLDPRDPPEGMRRGARLLSGIIVIVSNILLGSLTTLKEIALYGATDQGAGLTPLTDETVGGYTIWVPSSMIMIVAIVLVFNGWNRSEERRWNARHALMRQSNSAALEFPETAEELRLKVTRPNRDLGRTLGLAAFSMFAIVMVTAITVASLG